MNRLEELRSRQESVRDGLRHLVGLDTQDDEQRASFDWLNAEDQWLTAEIADEERRASERDEVRSRLDDGTAAVSGPEDGIAARQVNVNTGRTADVLNRADATPTELRDAARAAIERRVDGDHMEQVDRVLSRHLNARSGPVTRDWARRLVARSTDEYISAFEKYTSNPTNPMWTPEESRAIAVGTNTQGGFLVPTHLDPTILLTSDGSGNEMRSIARVVTLTEGNVWNGVTSAGVTASWDDEFEEVSDDSPEVANPSIPVHGARAFIAASIEAFQDMSGLAGEALKLFADAKDVLEGAAFMTGSGSDQPTGIFTALDANTNVEIVSTTAATIGEVDIHALYAGVPRRFRSRSTWLLHPTYNLAIKRLGTAVSSAFSGDLTQPVTDRILGRPVVESDDAPDTQTTTALDNEVVFGDFSNYVVVDKPGSMAVEFIPHLFGTTNGRPIGSRGWFAHWRAGGDSVVDTAFRLLQDKTSA